MIEPIISKIKYNQNVNRDEAEWLYLNADLQTLSQLATSVKTRFHHPEKATYVIMAIINYTNVCVAKCSYCSFYRLPHEKDTYLLNLEEVCQKIEALKKFGGSMVGFNGGFHPKLHIKDYIQLFSEVRKRYEDMTFYEMTVAEFMFTCKKSRISYEEGAQLFRKSGTKWITGGGAEILDDEFRKRHSPGKYRVDDYFKAQRAILEAGINSTATMVIGFDEPLSERLNHLEKLRDFQSSCGENRLKSFLCWTYKPWNNSLGGKEVDHDEYLRWLAICRIYLDNFQHIRTSVLTQNEFALNALAYGADDFDLPIEDEVTQKAGATISLDFKNILHFAEKKGYQTLLRSSLDH